MPHHIYNQSTEGLAACGEVFGDFYTVVPTYKILRAVLCLYDQSNLEIYFIENHFDAEKIAEQVLINKRSRENAERTRLNKMCIRDSNRYN